MTDPMINILQCNAGCGNQLGEGEQMVCAKCAEKLPPPLIEYVVREPRNLDHIVPGTCDCECHDTPGHYHCFSGPCCDQADETRSKLHQKKKRVIPKMALGDFTKFTFPLIRNKKKHDKFF